MRKYDPEKIVKMEEAGVICSEILRNVLSKVSVGVSLIELDQYAEQLCIDNKVIPAFKGYEGFPATLCTGVNDVVVHGIPDDYVLEDGDVLSVDFGIKYKDVYSDTSYTVIIGEVSDEIKKFVNVVKDATLAGIANAKPGNHVGDIGHAMQEIVEKNGYSVVKEMVGHGIGYDLHEEPYVPGYGRKGKGQELYRGQTLAIEAIVNQGLPDIFISIDDGWTSYTEDGMLSALFEHTIVVDQKPKILTSW
ncbi:type I methionyl aminopeptidase [Candidatus Nomurabacteria bacterium]|uniref:Methionine aminopeptidase n=1 Tax=Candidatus Dojkabacteria bacterium TaxID=2099670 RepID=A0A955I2P5_9BACT|nr:type I methionyl aminopeptidase [Candidatus Dojkabacteria bacterium]MCB9789401.1 type I methionyl aminopeptidase [Candidatus Nomurabacteria bacterium]MCB9803723.1 type I methionyl aminopeptidase [Candidatus Nomurabacteria bacterium]